MPPQISVRYTGQMIVIPAGAGAFISFLDRRLLRCHRQEQQVLGSRRIRLFGARKFEWKDTSSELRWTMLSCWTKCDPRN